MVGDPPPYTGDPMAANARLRALLTLLYTLMEAARFAKTESALFDAEQQTATAVINDISAGFRQMECSCVSQPSPPPLLPLRASQRPPA